MTNSIDQALKDCIEALETSDRGIEDVLAQYPGQAAELRSDLQVWASLASRKRSEASPTGFLSGLNRLSFAIRRTQTERGGNKLMKDLSKTGGFALKLLGATTVVAGLALGFAYFSGNMDVEFGSSAQAEHTNACLDSVLGNLDGDGHFTSGDLIAFKDAFLNQNTDPAFDTDGDGDVDVDDVMSYIQDLRSCFGGPPAPP